MTGNTTDYRWTRNWLSVSLDFFHSSLYGLGLKLVIQSNIYNYKLADPARGLCLAHAQIRIWKLTSIYTPYDQTHAQLFTRCIDLKGVKSDEFFGGHGVKSRHNGFNSIRLFWPSLTRVTGHCYGMSTSFAHNFLTSLSTTPSGITAKMQQ